MLQRLQVENDALKSKVCVQAWQEGGCRVRGLIDIAISAFGMEAAFKALRSFFERCFPAADACAAAESGGRGDTAACKGSAFQ